MAKSLKLVGLPEKNTENQDEIAFLKTRLLKCIQDYVSNTKAQQLSILICLTEHELIQTDDLSPELKKFAVQLSSIDKTIDKKKAAPPNPQGDKTSEEFDYQKRALQYKAEKPSYTFDRLILNEEPLSEIYRSLTLFSHHDKMYNEWGLSEIDKFPVVALNFYGPSGTGKTLAAHAIADYLHKNIIIASYAQIESMYHGEGPKNVEALFLAAQRDNAILFIDEADSLLSRRLTNVTQGSEQAINSMRSQLLICLEKFKGIVIFATNLAENYDKAFETRIRSIHFDMPDESCRKRIWECHIPTKFPLEEGLTRESVSTELAKQDDFCGRDIRNAVKSVVEDLILQGKSAAGIDDFLEGIKRVRTRRLKSESDNKPKGKEIPLDDEQKELLTGVIDKATKEGKLNTQQTSTSENNQQTDENTNSHERND